MPINLDHLTTTPSTCGLGCSTNNIQFNVPATHTSGFQPQQFLESIPTSLADTSTVVLITSLFTSVLFSSLEGPAQIATNARFHTPFSSKIQVHEGNNFETRQNFHDNFRYIQHATLTTCSDTIHANVVIPVSYPSRSRLHRHRALDYFYSPDVSNRIAQQQNTDISVHLRFLICQIQKELLSISPAKACLLNIFIDHIFRCSTFRKTILLSNSTNFGHKGDNHASNAEDNAFLSPICRLSNPRILDRLSNREREKALKGGASLECQAIGVLNTLVNLESLIRPESSVTFLDTAIVPLQQGVINCHQELAHACMTVEEKLLYVILRTSCLTNKDFDYKDDQACLRGLKGSFDTVIVTNENADMEKNRISHKFTFKHSLSSSNGIPPLVPSHAHHWALDCSEEIPKLSWIANPFCFYQADITESQVERRMDIPSLSCNCSLADEPDRETIKSNPHLEERNFSSDILVRKRVKLENYLTSRVKEELKSNYKQVCLNGSVSVARPDHHRSDFLRSMGTKGGCQSGDAPLTSYKPLLLRRPHCWLAPTTARLAEQSEVLQRVLCWSLEPDPVIEAMLWRSICRVRSCVAFAGFHPSLIDPDNSLQKLIRSKYEQERNYSRMYNTCFTSSAFPYRPAHMITEDMHNFVLSTWTNCLEEEYKTNTPVPSPLDYTIKEAIRDGNEIALSCYGVSRDFERVCKPSNCTKHATITTLTSSVSMPTQVVRPLLFFSSAYSAQAKFLLSMFNTTLHYCVVGLQDPFALLIISCPIAKRILANRCCTRYAADEGREETREAKRYRKGDQPTDDINFPLQNSLAGASATQAVGFSTTPVQISLSDIFFEPEVKPAAKRSAASATQMSNFKPLDPFSTAFSQREHDLCFTRDFSRNSYVLERELPRKSYEGVVTNGRRTLCGPLSLLERSCIHGTLFLRLEYLCEIAEQPQNHAGLGSYGRSAIEALQTCLLLIRRQVADLATRSENDNCITFRQLINAHERLSELSESIEIMANVFGVDTSDDWNVNKALQGLSSATLLSTLYECYSDRYTNAMTCNIDILDFITKGYGSGPYTRQCKGEQSEIGTLTSTIREGLQQHLGSATHGPGEAMYIIAFILLEALRPLHQMLHAWLTRSILLDPFDEFFIVSSPQNKHCGYVLVASPQRLPSFVSLEAARNFLQAGICLRVLRGAAEEIIFSAKRYERELTSRKCLAEDFEKLSNTKSMRTAVKAFLNTVLAIHLSTCVDLFSQKGHLAHWGDSYRACTDAPFLYFKQNDQDSVAGYQKSSVDYNNCNHQSEESHTLPLKDRKKWKNRLHCSLNLQNPQHLQLGVHALLCSDSTLQGFTRDTAVGQITSAPVASREEGGLVGGRNIKKNREACLSSTFKESDQHADRIDKSGIEAALKQPAHPHTSAVKCENRTAMSLERQDVYPSSKPQLSNTFFGQVSSQISGLETDHVWANKSFLFRGTVTTPLSFIASPTTTTLEKVLGNPSCHVLHVVKGLDYSNWTAEHFLQCEHERKIVAQEQKKRLCEWRIQRMSLRAARIQSINNIIEELRILYAPATDHACVSSPWIMTEPGTEGARESGNSLSPVVCRIGIAGISVHNRDRAVTPVILSKTRFPSLNVVQMLSRDIATVDRPISKAPNQLIDSVSGHQMSLSLSSAAAVCSTIDNGETDKKARLPLVQSQNQEENDRFNPNTSRCDRTQCPPTSLSEAVAIASSSSKSVLSQHLTGDVCRRGESNAISTHLVVNDSSAGSAPETHNDPSKLTHSQKRLSSCSQDDGLYVVLDINSDEFFQKRVGPKSYKRVEEISKLVTDLSTQASAIRNMSVNTSDYQARCVAVAQERIQGPTMGRTEADNCDTQNNNMLEHWADDDPLDVLKEDEKRRFLWANAKQPNSAPSVQDFDPKLSLLTEEITAGFTCLELTPANARSLYYCSSYYLSLSRCSARFFAQKAVQLLLLPPHGFLHRLLKQFIDLCVMQDQPAAGRIIDMWTVVLEKASRFSLFDPSPEDFPTQTVLLGLNEHFRREWRQCVLEGTGAEEAYWQLDEGAFMHEPKTKEITRDTEPDCTYGKQGPLRFLFSLRLCYTSQSLAFSHAGYNDQENLFSLLSDGCAKHYGQIFACLLQWRTMTYYAMLTWRLGLNCGGVLEVSFFCNTARSLLVTIQECVWDRLSTLCRTYRRDLPFQKEGPHAYTSVQDFTQDHSYFIEECLFAAMLDARFAPMWKLFMRLMRLIEMVHRMLECSIHTMRTQRRQILMKHSLSGFDEGYEIYSASDTRSPNDRERVSSSNSDKGMMRRLGGSICRGMPETSNTVVDITERRSEAYGKTDMLLVSDRSTSLKVGHTKKNDKKLSDDISGQQICLGTSSLKIYPMSPNTDIFKNTSVKNVSVCTSDTKASMSSKKIRHTRKQPSKVSRKKKKPQPEKKISALLQKNITGETSQIECRFHQTAEKEISEAHDSTRRHLRDTIKLYLRSLVNVTEDIILGFCNVRDAYLLKELDQVEHLINPISVMLSEWGEGNHAKANGTESFERTHLVSNFSRNKSVEYRQRVLTQRIFILTTLENSLQTVLTLLNQKI